MPPTTPPSASALTLLPDPESALQRAVCVHPDLCAPPAMARLREQLHMIINTLAASEKCGGPAGAVEAALRGIRLGVSAIMDARERQGRSPDEGVCEYLRDGKLDRVFAAGDKVWSEQVRVPLAQLIRDNRLQDDTHGDAVLSKILDRSQSVLHAQDAVQFTTEEFRRASAGDVRSMREVRAFTAQLAELRRVLSLAGEMGLDRGAIRRSAEPGIESGLLQLLNIAHDHLSYLEVAVLATAYRGRYGVAGVTSLTFEPREAQVFFRDFTRQEKGVVLTDEAAAAFDDACASAFAPENRETAKKVVRYVLHELCESINLHMFTIGDCPSPEYFFPVHRFSPRELTRKPARRRKSS